MLSILRTRNFALIWFGGLVSLTGDWALITGVPLVVYQLTGSIVALGLTGMATALPLMLVGSIAGVFVDRWDRRRTMLVADVLLGVLLLPLVLVSSTEWLWLLTVATPGAGKTTYALLAARLALARRPAPLLVVTPTAHLKTQWATAAARLRLHLDPGWSAADGGLPADMHGVVTTYQQVALHPAAVRRLASGAFVILDEVHHGGEERAWGAALQHAFGAAQRRLSLSGTPFRSDTRAIPFVRYHGVVRPVYFPAVGGAMEWSAADGALYAASFHDPLRLEPANQRLRTALSLEGEWLPGVLADAVYRLREVRRGQPNAGGLVVASGCSPSRLRGGSRRPRVPLLTAAEPGPTMAAD